MSKNRVIVKHDVGELCPCPLGATNASVVFYHANEKSTTKRFSNCDWMKLPRTLAVASQVADKLCGSATWVISTTSLSLCQQPTTNNRAKGQWH